MGYLRFHLSTFDCIGVGLSSRFRLLAEMNGSEGFYFRGGEVKARRIEDSLKGPEEDSKVLSSISEDQKVLSSISTSFPRRWKCLENNWHAFYPPSFRQQRIP